MARKSPIQTYMETKVTESANMLVPFYLMASYAYYVQDNPIITDQYFDHIGTLLLVKYDQIEHRHKDLITVDMLRAGTYLGEYPSIVEGATNDLRLHYGGKRRVTKRK